MPTLSDVRFEKLRTAGHTGSTSDMLLQWLQAGGATASQMNDAWKEWLADKGYLTGSNSDNWFAYLGSQGHTGSMNDREIQYWSSL